MKGKFNVEIDEDGLLHSATYLGTDVTAYLKHYKYIRKYQKNGHTYYVYDDAESKIRDKIYNNTIEKSMKSENGYSYTNKYGQYTTHKRLGKTTTNTTTLGGKSSHYRQTTADKAKETFYNNYQKHKVQKLKDIPRKIHAKGLSFISNILRRIRGD